MDQPEPSFTWRGLIFHWYPSVGSQKEGWGSAHSVAPFTVFFSVRKRAEQFVASATIGGQFEATSPVAALEGVLIRARAEVSAHALILESLK